MIEEFGFPRDGGSYEPGTPTTFKDKFYALIYAARARQHERSAGRSQGRISGAGAAKAGRSIPTIISIRGDTSYVGDPPHEPQGWYSVFDVDTSTQAVIRNAVTRARLKRRAR